MLVFVYGSLRKGFGNHYLLENSQFVKEATLSGFQMYSLGGFPAITHSRSKKDKIKGEIYEVNEATLYHLDRLEGHPNFYFREAYFTDDREIVQTYILDRESIEKWNSPLVKGGDWKEFKESA